MKANTTQPGPLISPTISMNIQWEPKAGYQMHCTVAPLARVQKQMHVGPNFPEAKRF